MIDKNNIVRIKWASHNRLMITLKRTGQTIYPTKKEALALLECLNDFVESYKEDFNHIIQYEKDDEDNISS